MLPGVREGEGGCRRDIKEQYEGFLFLIFIYLFIWLHRVLDVACGLFFAVCGLLSCCGTWGSVVVAHRLSSCGVRALECMGLVAPWHVGS